MKLVNLMCYLRWKPYLRRYLELPGLSFITKRYCCTSVFHRNILLNKRPLFALLPKRFNHDDRELEIVDEIKQVNEVYKEIYEQPVVLRHILYPNANDDLMKRINDCVSIEEALGVIKESGDKLMGNHLTQAVLTFWDLQRMYHHVNIQRSNSHIDETVFDKINDKYTKLIFDDDMFKTFLNLINNKRNKFNTEQLSYLILYLNKMGFDVKNEIFQNLVFEFNKKFFQEKFNLEKLSRFMSGLFKKNDLSFYYATREYIPLIYEQVTKATTAEDIKFITICLSTINNLVTNDVLSQYKKQIYELIIKGILDYNEYKTLIRVIMFLNYPQWRGENSRITSDCLNLLKGHLHLLNVNEVLCVYEVFYKSQEPGDILNELQRCASKYLLQLEEELSPLLDIRLRLFSCIMYFTSPSQRPHFDKIIRKYMDYNLDANSILELQKIMLFTKASDINLCRSFWGKILTYLDDENFTANNLLRICNSYINFEEITNTFRHAPTENKLLELLDKELKSGLLGVTPSHFSSIAGFILIYGYNPDSMKIVIERIEEFADQFNPIDCLNISQSLEYAKEENKLLSESDIKRVNEVLDYVTRNLREKVTPTEAVLLLKAALCRKNIESYPELWNKFNENLSSRLLKGISYCLYTSDLMIPDIIDLLTEYIIQSKGNVLGFNVERVLHLCFYFGYTPKNSNQFFDVITNILIRDQERMSGLSYIQACLALSFFNVLPQSFIKQIFNEEFLEKLDAELENCYFKDVYPLRVRHCMMRLNRAVCLDYPQANVPWFHQKYAEQTKTQSLKKTKRPHLQSLTNSLLQLANYKNVLHKDVILPYGYNADFIIHLDDKKRFTNEENSTQKVAILALNPKAYTKGVVQFKGSVQIKIRHLEMLGYKVVIVNLEEWRSLVYGQARIDYLNVLLGLREVNLNTGILTNR